MYGTYRCEHPWNGALYDVLIEFVRPDNHIVRRININRLEIESIKNLLDHNWNLLINAGLVTEDGSVADSSEDEN